MYIRCTEKLLEWVEFTCTIIEENMSDEERFLRSILSNKLDDDELMIIGGPRGG